MNTKILTFLASEMQTLGINYAFGYYAAPVEFPYFVGEYNEKNVLSEDGKQESTIILNGFGRDWMTLEQAKDAIRHHFDPISGIGKSEEGTAFNISFGRSFVVPINGETVKRIQIDMNVTEWSE